MINMPRQRGFTLIELLAAAALLALVAVMAFGGLSGLTTARDRIESTLETTGDIQRAVWRLQDDFAQVRARSIRDDYGDLQPVFMGGDEGVVFTRGGHRNPLQLPIPSLGRTAYVVEDGDLLRRVWPTLDRAQETDPRDSLLIEEVSDLKWRFLDGNREWQDDWPPLSSGADSAAGLPIAVELTFDSAQMGGITLLFRIMASA